MVRRLVRKLWVCCLGFLLRVPVVITSTILLEPGQSALMKSGASFARRFQVVSRPWRLS